MGVIAQRRPARRHRRRRLQLRADRRRRLAARACPVLLHEQNAQPGLTNRLVARVARAIAVTYDQTSAAFRRQELRQREPGSPPVPARSGPSHRGRGGCSSLAAPRARTRSTWPWSRQHRSWREATPPPQVTHQTGERDLAMVREGLARAGLAARVRALPRSHGRGDERGERDRLPRRRRRRWPRSPPSGAPRSWCRCRPPPTITNARTPRRCRRVGAAELLEQRDLTGATLAARVLALLDDEPRRGAARRRRQALRAAGRGARHRRSRARDRQPSVAKGARGRVMLGRTRRIHFVGIGGIGMSGIAEVLANLGYAVSGSDAQGVGRDPPSRDARACASSPATPPSTSATPTWSSSRRRCGRPTPRSSRRARARIPVIPRAEMLAELMRLKYGIAIAGSHGKTTTTSMVALLLDAPASTRPRSSAASCRAFGSNARLGQGSYLVAEADESDGSFLQLSPTIAVVTNIDREHLDHYGTLRRRARRLRRLRQQGAVLRRRSSPAPTTPTCGAAAAHHAPRRHLRHRRGRRRHPAPTTVALEAFGIDAAASSPAAATLGALRLSRAGPAQRAERARGRRRRPRARPAASSASPRRWPSSAASSAASAAAARSAASWSSTTTATTRPRLPPSLAAARAGLERRLVVVFQPHRYTRTERLLPEFGARWPRPTSSCSATSTPPARIRFPASPSTPSPRRCRPPAARRRSIVRAIDEVAGRGRRAGRGPATW